MKKRDLSRLITAVNFFVILILISVPFWGFWEIRFPFFFTKIPLWAILYYFWLSVVIGFFVYLLNKAVVFKKLKRMLWFYEAIPEHSEEIIVVSQASDGKLVIYLNKKAEEFFGVSRKDVISKQTFDNLISKKQGLQFREYPLESGGKEIFTIWIAKKVD